MRLAFWRTGKGRAVVQRAIAKPAPAVSEPVVAEPVAASEAGDLDLRALGQALMRRRSWITVPTVFAASLSIAAVQMVTPRYKSEVRIVLEGRRKVFLRPNGDRIEESDAH